MDRSEVIYYVSTEYTQDENHVMHATETRRKAYANVDSVTGAEWFNGGRNGLNPQYRFTVFFADYNGEKIVEYKGIQYAIYRTYQATTDTIELYTEYRKGTA